MSFNRSLNQVLLFDDSCAKKEKMTVLAGTSPFYIPVGSYFAYFGQQGTPVRDPERGTSHKHQLEALR